MPTTVEIDYLDGEFTVSESQPSTIAEITELLGEQGVVDETVSNLRYRNKYPRVYKKVSAAIAEKFPRPAKLDKAGEPVVKTVKGKDGAADTTSPVLADPTAHLRAYLATGEDARAELQSLFDSFGTSEALHVKGERSASTGGKIAQWAQDAASAKFAAGEDAVADAVLKIEDTVPGYKVALDAEGNATPESLARGVAALRKHFDTQAKNSTKSLLG